MHCRERARRMSRKAVKPRGMRRTLTVRRSDSGRRPTMGIAASLARQDRPRAWRKSGSSMGALFASFLKRTKRRSPIGEMDQNRLADQPPKSRLSTFSALFFPPSSNRVRPARRAISKACSYSSPLTRSRSSGKRSASPQGRYWFMMFT